MEELLFEHQMRPKIIAMEVNPEFPPGIVMKQKKYFSSAKD